MFFTLLGQSEEAVQTKNDKAVENSIEDKAVETAVEDKSVKTAGADKPEKTATIKGKGSASDCTDLGNAWNFRGMDMQWMGDGFHYPSCMGYIAFPVASNCREIIT